MELTGLAVIARDHAPAGRDGVFEHALIPCFDPRSLVQTHRLIRPSGAPALCLDVDMAGSVASWRADFERKREALAIPHDHFPYGMAEGIWWQYCACPHSYLDLGGGNCQVGLNFLDRFLHLDLNRPAAYLVNPGVGGELLSSTNWFDAESGELWFASWPGLGTVRRMLDPLAPVQATVWRLSLRDGELRRAWQGDFGDCLHHLAVSPDRRFLLLTELGLRVQETTDRLVPSGVLVVSLETGAEWRLPLPSAGHVEFDPGRPDVCYVSAHNIGLVGAKVGIFGPGRIHKYLLAESGPELLGVYSNTRFHRITTHAVFRHRGRTLIAVSGYPRRLFLIDAATMELHGIAEEETGERVDVSRLPHLCGQGSYGLSPSADGETLAVTGTGFALRLDVAEARLCPQAPLADEGAAVSFTGHLGRLSADR